MVSHAPRYSLASAFLALMLLASGCSGILEAESEDSGVVDRTSDAGEGGSDDQGGGGTAPDGEGQVTLSASPNVVGSGQSVTLSWSSTNVSACEASGGWSGSRPTAGTEVVGTLTQRTTFTLNCSGDGGNVMSMISVGVLGVVTVNWQPPAENVDGSALDDLAGYRIHYGSSSRSYHGQVSVADAGATEHALELESGSYYIAMTALNSRGEESGYSNEVVRVVD
jgi:hypothetical protein